MSRVACCLGLWVALAGCRSEAAPAADEVVVPIVATAEVKGTTEPCGCNSEPLGDVARVVALAHGGLLLDAGGLSYDRESQPPEKRPQADAKAAALAAVYAGGAVGLGADDLVRGAARVSPPRQAANVSGVATAPPRVFVAGGVSIGVFGVSGGGLAGVTVSDPAAAARGAIAALHKNGAQVVVALLGVPRADARALMTAVPGIDFGVVGADVGEGMAEAEPVAKGWLVAPADQGRRVARIALHVRGGRPALVAFGGEAARRLALERAQRKQRDLTAQLAAWAKDPTADAGFVAARRAELAALATEMARLDHQRPAPPAGSYFTYELVPVRRALPRDPPVEAQLKQLDRAIGAANFKAAAALPAPAAERDAPTYVGRTACAKCHQPAVDFWAHTVHAQAWKTLTDANKQYDYDCIGCHTTGFAKPGGANLAGVEKAGLVDVQCEVCHGPGSQHVKEAGLDDPPTLTRRPADSFCADNCHTKEHSDTFQLDAYLRDVLGKGHGEKRRAQLGDGVTGHALRTRALAEHR